MPYDPNWIKQFNDEALLIAPVFSDNFVAIHHIGSTSVPGLAAKPTIDIVLEVAHIDLVDACNDQMAQLGYEAWGDYHIPGRRFFVKGDDKRTHHVHTFQTGSADIARHLYFRDYLKTHPTEAQAYADLKIKLADEFYNDRKGYVLAKEAFAKALEQRAIEWSKVL